MKHKTLLCTAMCIAGSLYSQQEKTKDIDTVFVKKNTPTADNLIRISKEKITENTGKNLAEFLSKEAGLSMRQTGSTVAKPVIEGLANMRILILNAGVRLESQDWSDDHAPEIDLGISQSIKIIKGAKGVRYGAGALGGVIMVAPLGLNFDRKIGGAVSIAGNSNAGQTTTNAYLEGSFGKKQNWAWRTSGTYSRSGDYQTRDYFINNTGTKILAYSGEIGFRSDRWKSSLYGSFYQNESGIYYGAAVGNVEDLELRISLGRPLVSKGFSYDFEAPKQEVKHYFVKGETRFQLNENHNFSLLYSYQYNHRQEFDRRRLDRSVIPTQHTKLNSYFVEGLWNGRFPNGIRSQLGISTQRKENENIGGTGVVPAIPNYVLNNWGAFFSAEYERKKWLVEAGARADYRNISSLGYDILENLYGDKRNFTSFSYNAGFNYHITKSLDYHLNLGFAWRAPEPYELYAYGKQHGQPIFFIGDKNLNAEKGLKISSKLAYNRSDFGVEISAFVQSIKGFIYTLPTHDYVYLFSGPAALFRFVQNDAFLRGGDASLRFRFLKNWSYEGNVSVVYGNDKTNGGYLPQIPPLRLNESLKWDIPSRVFKGFYLKIEHQYNAKQNRFDPAFDLTADSPDGYHLFGAKLGANWQYTAGKSVNFVFGVENFTNTLYKNYMDRFRYFIHGKGLDIQLKTQFNF
ncbi:MAG: TonB-dependent receptor [Bergeyella zoohelcum]|nr:TonB-dependent receptor [Bergeyella zoohelcum]